MHNAHTTLPWQKPWQGALSNSKGRPLSRNPEISTGGVSFLLQRVNHPIYTVAVLLTSIDNMASEHSDSVSLGTVISLALLVCTWPIVLVVYRLYFSPIAGFPGPRIAAATGWYEFYYQFWLNGQYIFEIEKMHQKYGQ